MCLTVNADMPALELVVVPPEVPVRPNTFYFSLDSKSELYESMLKAQAITVYVPAGMKNLQLELLGIKA